MINVNYIPVTDVEEFLNNDFNVTLFKEVTGYPYYTDLFEPLYLFNLLYEQLAIVNANKERPLTVTNHLLKLNLNEDQLYYFLNKLLNLMMADHHPDYGIDANAQLIICHGFIEKEYIKLQKKLCVEDPFEGFIPPDKFNFENVKKHLKRLDTNKEKIKYLYEISTDFEQNKESWPWLAAKFAEKCQLEIKLLKDLLALEQQIAIDIKSSDLSAISADNTLAYYTDKTNIPNQGLLKDTINYFETGPGARVFKPLDFLNLWEKQNSFVVANWYVEGSVIAKLKSLPLSELEKHVLFGFLLKWFGGYPILETSDLDDDRRATKKSIEKEFLNYPDDTPEKDYCKADQARRNRYDMLGIAFTTSINHNIGVSEVLDGMGYFELKEKVYHDFDSLFSDASTSGLIEQFDNKKQLPISQSKKLFEFKLWLQTKRGWDRNEDQFSTFLTKNTFIEFLEDQKGGNSHLSRVAEIPQNKDTVELPAPEKQLKIAAPLSMRQIALICIYTDRMVTRPNGTSIANEYKLNSGDALFNFFTYYRSKANRLGVPGTKKKNENKLRLFEAVLNVFENNNEVRAKVQADLDALKAAINDF